MYELKGKDAIIQDKLQSLTAKDLNNQSRGGPSRYMN